jgi:hypothetical protein
MCDAISHFCCISTATPYGWLDFVKTHWNLHTHVVMSRKSSDDNVVWLSPPWYPKVSEDGKHVIIPAMSLWDPNVSAVVDTLKDLKNYEKAYWHIQSAEKTLLHIDLDEHSNVLNDDACVELWRKNAEHTMLELLVRFTNDTMSSVTGDHLAKRRQERERSFNARHSTVEFPHEATATDHVWPDVGWEHLGVLGVC